MILSAPDETVVHLFAGTGGCTEGFRAAGFRSLGSFDYDPKACRNLERLTGGPACCVNLAVVTREEMLRMAGPRAPGCVVMSPPCKAFSPCLPAAQAAEDDYQEMAKLALCGVVLACTTWDTLPGVIMIENVPRITSTGSEVLEKVVSLLHRYGYTIDQSAHDCGEIGGLAQHRDRYLLVARQPEVATDYLRRPPKQRVKAVSEVLGVLPSPVSAHGDEMHRQPLAAAMTWLRLAAVDPMRVISPSSKGDWRDIPARIRIGGPRPMSADPRLPRMAKPAAKGSRKAAGAPDDLGVGLWTKPHTTVRGRMDVQSSRASVADPRVVDTKVNRRASRKNGGEGCETWDAPAHTVVGRSQTRTAWASVADPRLSCAPRKGAYGVQDGAEPAGTIVGHHAHDNSVGSFADPKVGKVAGWRADPRRGTFGVVDPAGPSPTVRGRHDPRTAPAAVVDDRGWPVPTHELVVEDGELVLYGPPVDLDSHKPCLMVIRAPDGTWHRPMTDRELACLQGFPVDCYMEGPSGSKPKRKATATQPARPAVAGRREHIGNAIPPPTAEAIGKMILECLRSRKVATFLRGGDVWVDRQRALQADHSDMSERAA
jgi:site-specific DNA-cytosine methylase